MENIINNYISENKFLEAMEECRKNNFFNILKLLTILYKDKYENNIDFNL